MEIVKLLPRVDITSTNVNRDTPLHFASMNGKSSTCAWLLQNGADVHAVNTLNQTALDLARKNQFPVTELVLEDFINNQVA